jgi:hypothetical protein
MNFLSKSNTDQEKREGKTQTIEEATQSEKEWHENYGHRKFKM